MKKKWIAAIVVVLILAIGMPKLVDYAKFKKSQDFVYCTMQELSPNDLSLEFSAFFWREKPGSNVQISLDFDENIAAEFIQILQAAPKESYVTADSVGLEELNEKPYGYVLLYLKTDAAYHFRCQDGYVRILAWEQGIGHSFVIDDENLSALIEKYKTLAN